MNSVATRRFWDLFDALPRDIQNLAVKNYRLWQRDPITLRFISAGCRAARTASGSGWVITIALWAKLKADTITWV
jgi:hypothetical protein